MLLKEAVQHKRKFSVTIINFYTTVNFQQHQCHKLSSLEGSAITILEEDSYSNDMTEVVDIEIGKVYFERRTNKLQDCNKKTSLLIGFQQAYLGVTTTIIQADKESPIATKTLLGLVAYGLTKTCSIAFDAASTVNNVT
ncbi:unnamed protein product [Ceratitis capitata]|uniref:(Mediterranean fruit fly) hypothetical protein n=1 Tax=Ceratitis capitata TaxID=7213 RepID=A0A811USZ5_CERCA|nr:unnamed protein product [Ceratitis capitata]